LSGKSWEPGKEKTRLKPSGFGRVWLGLFFWVLISVGSVFDGVFGFFHSVVNTLTRFFQRALLFTGTHGEEPDCSDDYEGQFQDMFQIGFHVFLFSWVVGIVFKRRVPDDLLTMLFIASYMRV